MVVKLVTVPHIVLRLTFYDVRQKVKWTNSVFLREDLSKFWSVESVGSSGEDSVVNSFEKDITFNGHRYVTKLPFRPDHDILPDNFQTSFERLQKLKHRLRKENMIDDYDAIFKQYEKDGIIERVPESDVAKAPGKVFYLPHRSVIRHDKNNTKIRAVFDASCSVNQPSLNSCLYPGPNLLTKIFDVLLRFRTNRIGILANIKQAFLNVELSQEHQDFARFLWSDLNTPDENLIIYRFLRVVFGIACSPFLLNGTIRLHLEKYMFNLREFIERLLEDLYVDDVTSGCETVEEGKLFYETAKDIMSDGGFELRKWTSNNEELQQIFDNDRSDSTTMETGDDIKYLETQMKASGEVKRVLGIEWDTLSDEFVFRFDEFAQKALLLKPSKRNVLKVAASIYDPLGLISPITAFAVEMVLIGMRKCQMMLS